MKGKALRRALATADALRIEADVPLIVDTTELITPALAQEMLRRNKSNRPINWKKVEEYAEAMAKGEWTLHAQGIVLDTNGNILTGQKRLWAVVYSDSNVYMRVSRGNPSAAARLLDRGTPQSARDLATRGTGRKHSPVEANLARALCAMTGNARPSIDTLSDAIERNASKAEAVLKETTGTKKTRAVLLGLAAICAVASSPDDARQLARRIEWFASAIEAALAPQTAEQCWGRGAAFCLAAELARKRVLSSAARE